jgi:hypothetical protein
MDNDEQDAFDSFSVNPEKVKGDYPKLDYLVHRVFAQNKDGAELLALWKESLIMVPTAVSGNDLVSIGVREGMKQMIRNIILTVNKVETND